MSMSVYYFSIFVFLPLSFSFGQQITSDGCFRRYDNIRETCLVEVERRTGLTQQQCTDLCLQYVQTCKAAMYNVAKSSCDLFPAAGQMPNGKKKRSPYSGGRSRQGFNGRDGPPHKGPPPKGGGFGGGPPPKSACGNGACPPYGGYRTRCDGTRPLEGNCPGNIYYVPTGTCQGGISTYGPIITSTPQLPSQATCAQGLVMRYMEVKGYQLSGNPDYTFTAQNEQACTQACSDNKLPAGTFAPCQSADYNSQNSQCQIFLNAAAPSGTGTLNQNAATNHYEKICLDSNTGQNCPGPFLRAPQKLLVGYAETVATATSFSDCMQQCANSQTRFGFTCLSGQFYYSETTENCILNSESATTKPALYTDENQDKVDYFEPGCTGANGRRKRGIENMKSDRHRNVISLKSPDWGSWTRCDGKERHRKRYKGCSSLNPNHCQSNEVICDPSNRAKEWEEIKNEEIPTTAMSTTTTTTTTTTTQPPSTTTITAIVVTEIVTESVPFTAATSFVTDSVGEGGKRDENFCEPLLKPDGSKDCKNGFRKTKKGARQPCKPKILKGVC